MTDAGNIVHATALSYQGRGLLLRGASGAGKSDLALRLIREHQAILVSDDRCALYVKNGRIQMAAPETIRGLMEVRGIGIVPQPHFPQAALDLVIDLSATPERLPDPDTFEYHGLHVMRICLNPFETSVVQKINLALELGAK